MLLIDERRHGVVRIDLCRSNRHEDHRYHPCYVVGPCRCSGSGQCLGRENVLGPAGAQPQLSALLFEKVRGGRPRGSFDLQRVVPKDRKKGYENICAKRHLRACRSTSAARGFRRDGRASRGPYASGKQISWRQADAFDRRVDRRCHQLRSFTLCFSFNECPTPNRASSHLT